MIENRNPFKVITAQEITEYIDKLFEPFKVRGNPIKIIAEMVGENKDKLYDVNQSIFGMQSGDNGYVLFSPIEEKDTNAFAEIEAIRNKMIILQSKQRELVKLKDEYRKRRFSMYPEKYYSAFMQYEKEITELYDEFFPLEKVKNDNQQNPSENKDFNGQIFINYKAFQFFEELCEELKEEIDKNPLANYSFIFKKMEQKKIIHSLVKHSIFISFVNKRHGQDVIDRINSRNCETKNRLRAFSMVESRFK